MNLTPPRHADSRRQNGPTVESTVARLILVNAAKWTVIPVILIASAFSGLAGGYEPLMNALVCMGAIVMVQRAAWLHQYVSGAGFIAIAVVFGPFYLPVKIFLLLSLACVASCSAVVAGFRMQTSPAIPVTP